MAAGRTLLIINGHQTVGVVLEIDMPSVAGIIPR